jgi:hypothetical protein
MVISQSISPIERHSCLQPLSREHHHVLLLVWKIRRGVSKGIHVTRIERYVNWFFHSYIADHLELEENYVYPILGEGHELIRRGMHEHEALRSLFNRPQKDEQVILALATLLENHIRFEERILFNVVQEAATAMQLMVVEAHCTDGVFNENIEDVFW